MFEKEAEEYVCKRNPLVTKEWFIDAFKKYNKGEKVKYLKDCEIAEYEAYLAGAEPREKRIAELEKENAELKEQCSILADCNTCVSDCKTENIEIKKHLTKAKELLKQWVELYKPKLEGYPITPIQEQTEQFLSEVEK